MRVGYSIYRQKIIASTLIRNYGLIFTFIYLFYHSASTLLVVKSKVEKLKGVIICQQIR